MSRKSKIEAPQPKNIADLQEEGFHLDNASKPQCSRCSVAKLCDTLIQTDSIVVLAGGATCDTIRARGPKYN